MRTQQELIFVSGLSGAGKSVVLSMLEDLDYYCIDNLPFPLIRTLDPSGLAAADPRCGSLAVGIDARTGGDIDGFPVLLDELRAAHPEFTMRVLFLHADDDVLHRRFSETRRKHPLSDAGTNLNEALRAERLMVEPIASVADITIDTSHSNLHELRERVRLNLAGASTGHLQLQLQSFGFKHGIPDGVDMIFDARCLPNPHWESRLRPFTGRDQPVADWLSEYPEVGRMEADIFDFLQRWLPAYQAQDRTYLTIGIGCTGGQHRSVYLTERLATRLEQMEPPLDVLIRHTELRG